VRDIMRLLVIVLLLAMLIPSLHADISNVTLESKTFNVAGGGNSPYFYGIAVDNHTSMYFTPGKGEQRATVCWLNKIPLNVSLSIQHTNYIIERMWNITNVSNPIEI